MQIIAAASAAATAAHSIEYSSQCYIHFACALRLQLSWLLVQIIWIHYEPAWRALSADCLYTNYIFWWYISKKFNDIRPLSSTFYIHIKVKHLFYEKSNNWKILKSFYTPKFGVDFLTKCPSQWSLYLTSWLCMGKHTNVCGLFHSPCFQ